MMRMKGFAMPANGGEAFWFLGSLMTVKAGSEATLGGFTLIEQLAPAGFSAPPHTHTSEEEGFFLLEGEMRVNCGDDSWSLEPGGFVFLPRGVQHSFSISSRGPARILQITSPAQFERFLAEAAEPARERTLPPPSEPDIPRMLLAADKYGYEVAAPPSGG
jgi:uncharacterized cupin superfamily protein